MNPKFSVGEVVILKSIYYPEYAGEYEIMRILGQDDEFDDRLNEDLTCICDGDIAYLFTQPLARNDKNGECLWAESSLRKKHQPGEMSFKELMLDLKTNIQERIS